MINNILFCLAIALIPPLYAEEKCITMDDGTVYVGVFDWKTYKLTIDTRTVERTCVISINKDKVKTIVSATKRDIMDEANRQRKINADESKKHR